MWIGGNEMIGEVVEKKRAREIYESYKRVRRDPGLLEQVDYKNFELRIFPIGPEAEAASADHILPGTRLRQRLGNLRLPTGHGAARGHGLADRGEPSRWPCG